MPRFSRVPLWRFHEVMAEDSGQTVLSSLESHILPLVPGLTDRLAHGIRMLDLGCGQGRILTRLAALYPRSRFVGGTFHSMRLPTRDKKCRGPGSTISSLLPSI
jgi:hypothetical protein